MGTFHFFTLWFVFQIFFFFIYAAPKDEKLDVSNVLV